MKARYTFLLFLFVSCAAMAQNLVPNPSFEEIIDCIGPFDSTVDSWNAFKGSPDYISPSCTPNMAQAFGNVPANSGEAFAGFITYGVTNPLNAREFIGVELQSPLSVGEKYFLSFFLSPGLTSGSYNIATNNVGMLFTTYAFADPLNEFENPNRSNISSSTIVSEVGEWIRVSGSFVADSSYTYLVIGNFYDDVLTDTLYIPSAEQPAHRAYSLVDDVCVSTDSAYNEVWTTLSVSHIQQPITSIYPNPASEDLRVESQYSISEVRILNLNGSLERRILELNDNLIEIPTTGLASGLYIIEVNTLTNKFYSKILINK